MSTVLTLLDAIRTHLDTFAVPVPLSVNVGVYLRHIEVHAPGVEPPELAADLLAWADTLTTPTAEAWRTHDGDRVHLSVRGQLPSGHPVRVYGAIPHHPQGVGGHLEPDHSAPVPLPALRHLADLTAEPGEVSTP